MINGNIAGLIAILFWCVSPLLVINTINVPVFLLAFYTLGFASLLLFAKYTIIDKISLKHILIQSMPAYALTSIGIGGYILFWYLAFRNAPAFAANTLNYLWPILLVLLSMVGGRENFSFIKMAGLFLGFIGTLLIFLGDGSFGLETQFLLGYIFAVTGAVIWAFYSYMTYYFKFKTYAMAAYLFVPSLVFLVLHLIYETPYVPSLYEIIFILLLGLTRVSFAFWDYAMKNGTLSFISSMAYFIPVISTVLLISFDHLPNSYTVFAGAFSVILGCIAVNRNLFKNEKS